MLAISFVVIAFTRNSNDLVVGCFEPPTPVSGGIFVNVEYHKR